MSNPNFQSEGRLRATINSIIDTVEGVNEKTGEVFTYLVVDATTSEGTPIKYNIFIDKFNSKEDIKAGAAFDIVYSTNVTTGKVNGRAFMASKYASTAQMLKEAGASATVIEAGKQQARSAMEAVRARQAARANAAK
jgi:hypothetical protein